MSLPGTLRSGAWPGDFDYGDFPGGGAALSHRIPAHRMRMGVYQTKIRSVWYESRYRQATEGAGHHPAENF